MLFRSRSCDTPEIPTLAFPECNSPSLDASRVAELPGRQATVLIAHRLPKCHRRDIPHRRLRGDKPVWAYKRRPPARVGVVIRFGSGYFPDLPRKFSDPPRRQLGQLSVRRGRCIHAASFRGWERFGHCHRMGGFDPQFKPDLAIERTRILKKGTTSAYEHGAPHRSFILPKCRNAAYCLPASPSLFAKSPSGWDVSARQ